MSGGTISYNKTDHILGHGGGIYMSEVDNFIVVDPTFTFTGGRICYNEGQCGRWRI